MVFRPFENESDSLTVDNLTIENRVDRLSIYGTCAITRDREGLTLAKELLKLLQDAVATLERNSALPERLPPEASVKIVKNPFA